MQKKLTVLLLGLAVVFLLAGCHGPSEEAETVPVTTQMPTETTAQATTMAPPALELTDTELTIDQIGQCCDIYCGETPAEIVYWYSDDSSVAAVDCGVVTAMGHGVTNVHGLYCGQRVTCTVTSNASYRSDRTPILKAPDYENVDAGFFDDAVFVGDSISLKLSRFHGGRLGNAQFLVQSSFSVYNAIYDLMPTTYRGREYRNLEDALAATGAKKIFIMLGINDIGIFGVDQTLENWRVLFDLIQQACPDAQIYIQSVTPMWTGSERKKLTNSNIHTYNFLLRFLAEEYGFGYIDIAPYLQDCTGGLAKVYSSDQYVHITEEGVAVWVSALRAFAGYYE